MVISTYVSHGRNPWIWLFRHPTFSNVARSTFLLNVKPSPQTNLLKKSPIGILTFLVGDPYM